jgi:signal transduction histidine kinase
MARRAKALGGILTIESSRSRGTDVGFEFPLPK